jgi:hypothetical protein
VNGLRKEFGIIVYVNHVQFSFREQYLVREEAHG